MGCSYIMAAVPGVSQFEVEAEGETLGKLGLRGLVEKRHLREE